MATATVDWVPTSGGSYEIWYGKLSVVGTTSLPPDSGWIQATGSPFNSSLGEATITGLDDNTQYRVVSRADCTGLDSTWIDDTGYKLICPALQLTTNPINAPTNYIVASLTAVNLLEFETIASALTLVIKKTSTGAIVETKTLTAPYTPNFSGSLTYTFNNLLPSTQYTVYLTIHDGILNQDITCSNVSQTTPTPVVTPPPVCTAPTFTLSNAQPTSLQVNITSTILTGDTFDVSLDGGVTYPTTGQTVSPIIISAGVSPGTQYTVMVRRHCQAGGVNTSTSQTLTTPNTMISGTISMNSDRSAVGTFASGTLYLAFNFPLPTPAALTFYFGYTHENSCTCPGGKCKWSNGYDIFTPAPTDQNCSGTPIGNITTGGVPHYPFVVVVPQGVTTFTTDTNIHTSNPSPSLPNNPWQNTGAGNNGARGYTDLYVKIDGYSNNLTMVNGANISGVTIHNV